MSASQIDEDGNFQCPNLGETVLKKLQNHFENQQLCDVVLIAGNDGTRVPAHRVVLSASTDYFSAMFMGSLRESKEEEVTLGEMSGEILQVIVQYCYTGRIQLRQDSVESLLATASLLQLNDVVTACCDFLVNNLDHSNCLEIALFAEQLNCSKMQKQVEAFIQQNYMAVSKREEFLQLDIEHFCKLLASDEIIVESEEVVCFNCISWLNHDCEERIKYIPNLLALVRLSQLPPDFLTNHVKLLAESNTCNELIIEAVERQLSQTSSPCARPRKSPDGSFLCIERGKGKDQLGIHSYNICNDEWTVWNEDLPHRLNYGCVLFGNSILIVGGRINSNLSGSVDSFDLDTKAVTEFKPLYTPRQCMGCAVMNDRVYVVGGMGSNGILDSVERWDPLAGSWIFMTSMTVQRSGLGVAVLGNHLYAIGGISGLYAGMERSVESYDPKTNVWSQRSSMNMARVEAGVAAGNGFLYAIGGQNDNRTILDTVERYDPVANKWTMICSISSARRCIGSAVLGNKLFAIGGKYGQMCVTTFEEYDPETDAWSQKSPFPENLLEFHLVHVPNKYIPSS